MNRIQQIPRQKNAAVASAEKRGGKNTLTKNEQRVMIQNLRMRRKGERGGLNPNRDLPSRHLLLLGKQIGLRKRKVELLVRPLQRILLQIQMMEKWLDHRYQPNIKIKHENKRMLYSPPTFLT
jgi:hypothetical protein